MGIADFYKKGAWNFHCDLCGRKRKSTDGKQTWNKLWVCREHREERNPQDFVRGVKDDQSVPWSRPEAADQFVALAWERSFSSAVGSEEQLLQSFAVIIPNGAFRDSGNAINSSPLGATVLNESGTDWLGPLAVESVGVSDTITFERGIALSDAVSSSDQASNGSTRNFSDAVAASDGLSLLLQSSLSDTSSTSDASTSGQLYSLTDAVVAADTLSKSVVLGLSDSLTLADAPVQQIFTSSQLNGRALNGAALNA